MSDEEINESNNSIINVVFKEKPPTVLITSPTIPEENNEIKLLRNKYKIITLTDFPPDRNEILKKVYGVEGILWIGGLKLDEEIMKAAGKQLKIISVLSCNLDHIDIEKAKELNITVRIVEHIPPDSKADIAIGLMISVARCYVRGRNEIKKHNWDLNNSNPMLWGQDIRGSTVGIIGFDSLAQAIHKRLIGFNVKSFLYADPNNELGSYKISQTPLNKLLRTSDFIFLCCSLTDNTVNIINENSLNKMKLNCVLVNVLRPQLIDQEALYKALSNNRIFGAGLDSFDPELLPIESKFLKLDNLLITPQIGWSTYKTNSLLMTVALNNLLRGLASE